MGRVCVSFMFVVHAVGILSAVFCVICLCLCLMLVVTRVWVLLWLCMLR